MSVRSAKQMEGRSAPARDAREGTVQGAETTARGTDGVAGVGNGRGPWVFSCLYTAQKMKKKKSWKDGVCVCDQMTGFLRVTLFGAESSVHSTLLKARRSADALDTTELPLKPVDELLDDEIELPLHLVQIQGFAVEFTSAQEQLRETQSREHWPANSHPQHQQQHRLLEQDNMSLRRTSPSCCEPFSDLKAAQEARESPTVGTGFAHTAPMVAPAAKTSSSVVTSSGSNENATAYTAVDDERPLLPARPRARNSIPGTTQLTPFLRSDHDCHTRRMATETSPSDISLSARRQAHVTQKTPHSFERSLRREIRSIMSDTQSRRAPATRVMLRTPRSLFWQQQFTRSTAATGKGVVLPLGAQVRGAAVQTRMRTKWRGSQERMMFSCLFDFSAGCF